jgi:diguanylate cyclase (GGDEF)-like protein
MMNGMKVLVVDDSPDALAIAQARLAKEGLEVHCAAGGRAGLDAARALRPDLVLLDVDMPDLSGFDVCRAMKADPDLCMIPVIFLSGFDSSKDRVKGLDVGAVDYVAKPFDAFELRARVRAALRTKRLQDLLVERAHVDPLTELANRRALDDCLRREWARAQRQGGGLSVIMADLDHFKQVNDTHGHPIGDKLLRGAARAIAAQCRQSDLPARYGGEEFAVVVPAEPAPEAALLAERCRQEIEGLRVPLADEGGSQAVGVTASFGVADSRWAGSPESLVELADANLYLAKQGGRNTVVSAPPQDHPNNVSQLGRLPERSGQGRPIPAEASADPSARSIL